MKTYMHRAGGSDARSPNTVRVEMTPHEASDLMDGLGIVLSTVKRLDPAHKEFNADAVARLDALFDSLNEAGGPRYEHPPAPARVPSDRPTDIDAPQVDDTEPEPAEREALLREYIDIITSHIPVQHREFTVRIYQTDFTDRRFPNETLARTFPTEEKARDFYGRTQNIQNMKVRVKEAAGFDVVLGVQDKRSHAKKKSYREWEHTLCKGGPG